MENYTIQHPLDHCIHINSHMYIGRYICIFLSLLLLREYKIYDCNNIIVVVIIINNNVSYTSYKLHSASYIYNICVCINKYPIFSLSPTENNAKTRYDF